MVRLEDIAAMNPWWSKGYRFAEDDRDLLKLNGSVGAAFFFERTVPRLEPDNIYVVKGPRRVGKTVWIKKLVLKLLNEKANPLSIFYYSLENVKDAGELRTMLVNFLSKPGGGTKYILLDEVQGVKGWEIVLKGLADQGALRNAVTIVTGSLAHLFRQELMPGRGTEGNTYIMHPCSFNDFCNVLLNDINTSMGVNRINPLIGYNFTNEEAGALLDMVNRRISLEESISGIYSAAESLSPYAIPIRKMFEVYLRTGGYPFSINSYFADFRQSKPRYTIDPRVYEEIYLYAKNDATILAGLAGYGDPAKAAMVLGGALRHIGERMSYSKLSAEAGMNTKTFISYSKRLEESYVFIRINGVDKMMKEVMAQKSYFSDVFIHYSVGAAETGEEPNGYSEKILNSSAVGAVVEEMLAAHLSRVKELDPMRGYGSYLKFFSGAREIDFVFIRDNGDGLAVESKYQSGVSQKNDITRIGGIKEYVLLSKDELARGDDYAIIPVQLFLALLGKSPHDL
jgi:hypothetical protein